MNASVGKADYRVLLKRELEARCERNPRYSLRSFARDLDMAPARLSDVLRARYGLSREAAAKISHRLGWNPNESEHFCDLVESEHARGRKKRMQASEKLQHHSYQQLTADAFQVVSDWYHYAILELTSLEDFESDSKWMAKRLGVNENLIQSALERLERLELLEKRDGRWVAGNGFTASPSGVPSEAIKKFHRQILEKALSSIYLQNLEERDFSSMILAVDKEQMPQAKEAIKDFRRDFDKRFGGSQKKNEVYCLGIQFFKLSEKKEIGK